MKSCVHIRVMMILTAIAFVLFSMSVSANFSEYSSRNQLKYVQSSDDENGSGFGSSLLPVPVREARISADYSAELMDKQDFYDGFFCQRLLLVIMMFGCVIGVRMKKDTPDKIRRYNLLI